MKKGIIKVFSIVLALGISVTLLASCGGSEDAKTENTSAQTELVE